MNKLFINDFEYKLDYVKKIKNIYHFNIVDQTNYIINFDIEKIYTCTIHYNGKIIDIGEKIKIRNRKNKPSMYFIGESINTSVCFKLVKTGSKEFLVPLFVSLDCNYYKTIE